MKNASLFLFIVISTSLFSQEKYTKEISLKTDNDLFTSTYYDRYYTSGIFLSYRLLSKTPSKKYVKKIVEWQIGHQMYTPFTAIVPIVALHDRPFAAYLYINYGVQKVFKNNRILKTSLALGVIGSAAFGQELQDFIHTIYNFKKAVGWKYQIKNALALNFNANYTQFLTKDASNHFDVSWVNTAKIGTVFTDVSTGIYTRIGFKPLQKLANSIAFHTNLNDDKSNFKRVAESFLYIKPTVSFVLYDATIQGSFLNPTSPVTKEIVPFKFDLEIGYRFTANRFNFGYFYHFYTNKVKNLRFNKGNYYGQIMVNYLLR